MFKSCLGNPYHRSVCYELASKRALSRRHDTKVTGQTRGPPGYSRTIYTIGNYMEEPVFAPRHVAMSQLERTILVSIELLLIYCGSTACCNESPYVQRMQMSKRISILTPHSERLSRQTHCCKCRRWPITQRSASRKFAHRIKDYHAIAKIMPAQMREVSCSQELEVEVSTRVYAESVREDSREQHHQQRSGRGRRRRWRRQRR